MRRRDFIVGLVSIVVGAGIATPPSMAADLGNGLPPMPTNLDPEFIRRAQELQFDLISLYGVFAMTQLAYEEKNLAGLAEVSLTPLKLLVPGDERDLVKFGDFKREEKWLFKSTVASVVASTTFDRLFLTADGAMFGQGEVWIKQECLDAGCSKAEFGVATINAR